jgi:DnaJ-class molecular chaperone
MHNGRRITGRERRALKALDLAEPCTPLALKTQYRSLVKHYHPDLHKGDPVREERFKEITEAYTYLMKLYQEDAAPL